MEKRNIIVIGASSGGFEVIKTIVAGLPSDLAAALFVVWHMPADVMGIMPEVLSRQNTVQATHAKDHEPIVYNHIYVAPPDRHLLLEPGIIKLTNGPKENRFRPAVDPLFRSAALAYGSRVIGVVLSGGLDDGTAGLLSIKQLGGLAVVQDPETAEFPSMPENALRLVDVDYKVSADGMASLLVTLSNEPVQDIKVHTGEIERMQKEIKVANPSTQMKGGIDAFGNFSPYTCPECSGTLSEIKDGQMIRYRCHTGHSFTSMSLLSAISENIEHNLWKTVRGIEECITLLKSTGDYYASINQPKIAGQYFKKAREIEAKGNHVMQALVNTPGSDLFIE